MTALVVALASLPCVYWTHGVETKAQLDAASITRICVPAEQAERWRAAGVEATPVTAAALAARNVLPAPGIAARAGLASPTRAPWIVANGWQFQRDPAGKYAYQVPVGKAALAAAEAFAYGADALLQIDPADLGAAGAMLTFLAGLPPATPQPIADLAVVDDGSAAAGEVMNLLARRNLLFERVTAPSSRYRINVALGSRDYPTGDAADPSAFALKIRRALTDDERTLRVYGSETVIARLTGDAQRVRLHLLNYAGRDIQGLRIRLRGAYREATARVDGAGTVALQDYVAAADATEFSVPTLSTYAVIDLDRR